MRLLFRASCKCKLTSERLPKPSLKVTEGFDTDDPEPEVKLSVDILCPVCKTPWEGFAGLAFAPKSPRRIIAP